MTIQVWLMKVKSFVSTFTPDITPRDEKRSVYSMTLLWHVPNLSFSVEKVKECLSAYLRLMDEGANEAAVFIADSDPKLDLSNYDDVVKVVRGIMRSWYHMEASELMQVYLRFAPYNDTDFIAFLHTTDAVNRVQHFMGAVNPHEFYLHPDVFKRVVEVYEILVRRAAVEN